MRVDLISVFPGWFAPLELSLLGRARRSGLLELHVHDLRTWTSDRHRTVDDTPYGGGAGMVMKPEPWGDALDAVIADGAASSRAASSGPASSGAASSGAAASGAAGTGVVPTPAGRLFTQATAGELAERPWLVFACGRYEGIDQRVVDHFAARADVREVRELSIGDYVLNGGEVAAAVVVEAVARLLPGFVGNPDSLVEESHAAGEGPPLLEHPVYTKPASWRGLDVPEVLLSGDHGQIAAWRREQALRRTAARRPDLAYPSEALTLDALGQAAELRPARPADAAELWTLRRSAECSASSPFSQTLEEVRRSLGVWRTFVVRVGGRLVASVAGRSVEAGERKRVWEVGGVTVAPDLEGRGLDGWLVELAERQAPPEAASYRLLAGGEDAARLRALRRAGYRRSPRPDDPPGAVTLVKPRTATGKTISG